MVNMGYIYVAIPHEKLYKIYTSNCQTLPIAAIAKKVKSAIAEGKISYADNISLIVEPFFNAKPSVKSISVSSILG